MASSDTQQLMTVGEAATWLRCSNDCIYDAVRREEIPAIRVGRLIRIPKSALLTLAASARDSVPEHASPAGTKRSLDLDS